MSAVVSAVVGIVVAALVLLVACAASRPASPRVREVVCDAVAIAPLVPRFRAAIDARDAAALVALLREVGHDASVCALQEHAKAQAAGSDSTGKAP